MMANAGVTWKLGHRDPETAIARPLSSRPDQLGLRITTGNGGSERRKSGLKGEVADLKSENAEMKKNIAMLMAKLGM